MIDDGGPAFACSGQIRSQAGMSLRDWFAGQALSGMNAQESLGFISYRDVASRCYEYADAMLEARK